MNWPVRWIALVVLAGALAVVSPAGGQARPEPNITDAEGDATEWNGDSVRAAAAMACQNIPGAGDACHEASHAYPEEALGAAGGGGVPAHASMDIVAAWFEEQAETLRVVLQLAALDPAFTDTVADGRERTLAYHISWNVGPDWSCWERADLRVERGNGVLSMDARYFYTHVICPGEPGDGGGQGLVCNDWWVCAVGVPVRFDGDTGTITWEIPRHALRTGHQGATLADPIAIVARIAEPAPVEPWLAVGGPAPLPARPGVHFTSSMDYVVDWTEPGTTFTLATPLPPAGPSNPAISWDDERGEAGDRAGPRPDFDIWSTTLVETPTTFEFVTEVALVEEEPRDLHFYYNFATPSGRLFEGGFVAGDGAYQDPYAFFLARGSSTAIVVPVQAIVAPGEPGTIRTVFDRADLGPISAGEALQFLIVDIHPDDRVFVGRDAMIMVVETSGPPFEWAGTAPPYRFVYDTPTAATASTVLVEDAPGDAALPTDAVLGSGRSERYDITYIQAEVAPDGVVDMAMGLRDVSAIEVPPTYDAVFYAIGAQQADTAAMVGYYKHRDEPGGEFFCAPDTAVLTRERRDPTTVVWTTIDGVVRAIGHDDIPGQATPGTLNFRVPRACLGANPEGDVPLARFAGATFLMRGAPRGLVDAELVALDEVAADGPLVVPGPIAEELAPAAWYAAPFGLANFWDIMGLTVAGVVAVGGGTLRLQHRHRDKRAVANAKLREDRDVYKAALAKAVARGTTDPDGDEVLQALRRRLGIGEREHALILLEARAAAGLGTGLTEGDRFLGKYRIERLLGEGGFARTFLARDERLGRSVVLKVARWDDPKEAARALKEAKVLARLDHPNIVAIHDAEEVAGEVVLVLEFMPRGSLAGILAKGPVTPGEALSITDDILTALEASHAQGIVHCDVKPANILLTAHGRAKLADFGIAARTRGTGTATGASLGGNGVGTLAYMAPEQARGGRPDPRADLYATGAVLYEMIVGSPYLSLEGLSDYEARTAIMEDPPALPIDGAPEAVNRALAAALSKDPGDRPRNAAEMRRLLAAKTTAR